MEWTNNKLKSIWPTDINYSDYKAKTIRKIIKDKYKNFATKDLVRNLIKERFLNFKPSTEEFDCEKINKFTIFSSSPLRRYPTGKQPDLTWAINGGWRNIRKADMFS